MANGAIREITLDALGLGAILSGFQLQVPPNQRDYAWEDEHTSQLFTDLSKAFVEGTDYFVGSIVTIPRGPNLLEVVDGQQRLATTAILLSAIRDYLSTLGEATTADSVSRDFLTDYDRTTREWVTRLRLNIDDNELFANLLRGTVDDEMRSAARGSRKLLIAASDLASEFVGKTVGSLDPKDHHDHLVRLVEFLQFKVLAILLQVPNAANAFQMFETLNDRGLATSQADLIKNYLFRIADNRVGEVQGKWNHMRGVLESLDDEELSLMLFLRHALIVMAGYLREADIYNQVQELAKSPNGAATTSAQLEQLSTAYVSVFNPEHERWVGYPDLVGQAIEVFNLLNIKPMRPLLLAVATRFDPEEAAKAFTFLVALGVRLMIASTTRSGSVEIPLANTASKVYLGELTETGALRTELAGITPTDTEFEKAFAQARSSKPELARYLLRSLEKVHKGESEPWFSPNEDRSQITLEHILPRKPGDLWPAFDEDLAAEYTNRIGNLALLRHVQNSTLKSEGFAAKKPAFGESPYGTTAHVADFADWTPEAIEERQRVLAGLAVKAWSVKT